LFQSSLVDICRHNHNEFHKYGQIKMKEASSLVVI